MKSKGGTLQGYYGAGQRNSVIIWKRSTKNLVSAALSSDFPEVKDRWKQTNKKIIKNKRM